MTLSGVCRVPEWSVSLSPGYPPISLQALWPGPVQRRQAAHQRVQEAVAVYSLATVWTVSLWPHPPVF